MDYATKVLKITASDFERVQDLIEAIDEMIDESDSDNFVLYIRHDNVTEIIEAEDLYFINEDILALKIKDHSATCSANGWVVNVKT